MDKKVVKRSLFSYVILFGVIIGIFFFINVLNTKVNELTYNELLKLLENQNGAPSSESSEHVHAAIRLLGNLFF